MSRLVFLSIAILSLLPVVAPAAPVDKRPAPRWHGYGFLPGYHQPPNNSLPAYAQKASVSRMARRNPWYIDPIPSYYGYDGDWHYFGRPGFYGGALNRARFVGLDLRLRSLALTPPVRTNPALTTPRSMVAPTGMLYVTPSQQATL